MSVPPGSLLHSEAVRAAPAEVALYRARKHYLHASETLVYNSEWGAAWCAIPSLSIDTRDCEIFAPIEVQGNQFLVTCTYTEGAGSEMMSRMWRVLIGEHDPFLLTYMVCSMLFAFCVARFHNLL